MKSSTFNHEGLAGRVRKGLDLKPDGYAERMLLADAYVIQQMWRELGSEAQAYGLPNIRRDYSEEGTILMAGRTVLPHMAKPVYWAARDGRVHFSVPMNLLKSEDRVALVNQVLVTYADRSQKDDVKSAALAVSETGHFYVAMNTQELPTMEWDKECAETNLTRLVKQLGEAGEKIEHMYVLGGLKAADGKMSLQDHLIGMCMRCVETVSAIMTSTSKVTVIPANHGEVRIPLTKADCMADVPAGHAWQAHYWVFKGPSIISYPPDVHDAESFAFEAICAGLVDADALLAPYGENLNCDNVLLDAKRGISSIPFLEANNSPEALNAYMVAQLARQIKRGGEPSHASIAVVEINDRGKLRYASSSELRGARYNAMQPPVSGAIANTAMPRPKGQDLPYISRVFVMGYNADDSPLNLNAEQWDRTLKRAGNARAAETMVTCIPLNIGIYPEGKEINRPLSVLAPTAYAGSKHHAEELSGHHCSRC